VKCLVSGATGFIGRLLCQRLIACGYTVIALSKSGAPLVNGQPTIAMNLAEQYPDNDLLSGVDVFFHLAGIAHQRAQESAYTAVNYEATLRLARLASSAGVGCFVFLSSVKAMGACQSPYMRTESGCTLPVDAYGLSKWRAECALRDEFSNDRMSVVIVRPALVYGAEARGNLQSLATGVRWGLPRPPQLGRRSMIALDDLVELLCVIALNPPAGVQTWIACGADAYSTREIYDLLRAGLGKGRGRAWLPRWAWHFGSRLVDIIAGRGGEPTYEKLFGTALYSNAAVLKDTGWQPRIRLEQVIGQLEMRGSDRG
jgi:nucleoside-diphosphate-sugar epimerase